MGLACQVRLCFFFFFGGGGCNGGVDMKTFWAGRKMERGIWLRWEQVWDYARLTWLKRGRGRCSQELNQVTQEMVTSREKDKGKEMGRVKVGAKKDSSELLGYLLLCLPLL